MVSRSLLFWLSCLSVLPAATVLVSCNPEIPERPGAAPDKPWFERDDLSERRGKILLMHYMPWYETPKVRGRWGSHWTGHRRQHDPEQIGEDGLPDIWSHYHPRIGLYDSADPHAVECHLLQMKLAGVDGVIADWYGISRAADYPPIHEATRVLFEATGRLGMKFAACYEDRSAKFRLDTGQITPGEIVSHVAGDIRWVREEWSRRPQYFWIDQRPLLLNFGPIQVKEARTWDIALGPGPGRPRLFALHHLWKGVQADGAFTWVHASAWDGDPDSDTVRERLHRIYSQPAEDPDQVIVSAYPGFRDVYEESHPVVEHRDGLTMEETLRTCLEGPWPLVQLVTWNDYGEGTMIEPTHEFGYLFLEIIQRARREELGERFSFQASDLRLPARLYALRKDGRADTAPLDEVARLLSRGEVRTARERLAALEKATRDSVETASGASPATAVARGPSVGAMGGSASFRDTESSAHDRRFYRFRAK